MGTDQNTMMAALHDLAGQPPLNQAQLDRRLGQIATIVGIPTARARSLVASGIVAQLLPEDMFIKGGIGVKCRIGETGTRATSDLDVASRHTHATAARLTTALDRTWGEVPASKATLAKGPDAAPRPAFHFTVRQKRQARPAGVESRYVMVPYQVTMSFLRPGPGWASVLLEMGIDEFNGSTIAPPQVVLSDQIRAMIEALGCGPARPVRVISIEQQLAQKIHAVTDPAELRGHDLVDIQLLWHHAHQTVGGIDMDTLGLLCRRTFDFRSTSREQSGHPSHVWPPDPVDGERLRAGYDTALAEARTGLDSPLMGVEESIEGAAAWLTGVVQRITTHRPPDSPNDDHHEGTPD